MTIGNLFLKMSYPPYQKRKMVTINYCCRRFEKIYHPNFNHLKKIVRFFLIVYSLSVFSQNCVTTYAGNGLTNLINGDIHLAQFNNPTGICRDRLGNIFIADGANHAIRLLYKEAMPTSTHAAEDPRFSIEQKEERIVIQFPSTIDAPIQMKIVDLLGHIAPPNFSQRISASENSTSIDISALSTGLYVLNIAYKGENISFKIIK